MLDDSDGGVDGLGWGGLGTGKGKRPGRRVISGFLDDSDGGVDGLGWGGLGTGRGNGLVAV